MALVLDGNGTIAGVNAGGLPNGSVTADTLATSLNLTSKSLTVSGITFPATQSASSDANTLDDYEEGTWTPVVYGTSSAGTATYTTQKGIYTKVGNTVIVSMVVAYSGHTGTGNMRISGLPFSGVSTYQWMYPIDYDALTVPASQIPYIAVVSNTLIFGTYTTGGTTTNALAMDAASTIYFGGSYQV